MPVQSPMDCSVTLPKQPQAISETKPLGLSCLLRCLRRGFLNLVPLLSGYEAFSGNEGALFLCICDGGNCRAPPTC